MSIVTVSDQMAHVPSISNEEEATLAIGAWRLPPLYKYDSMSRVRVWKIMFDGPSIITMHGLESGKMNTSTSSVKLTTLSKNLSHQAYIRANGKYTKKVKEGMASRDAVASSTPGDYNRSRGKVAMLAHHYQEGRLVEGEQFAVQRKYDGLRCRARMTEMSQFTKASLIKRGGDRIPFCKLIRLQAYLLLRQLPYGWQLDGELYSHGMTLQQIEGIVNRSVNVHADDKLLSYYVFDLIPPNLDSENATYAHRRSMLIQAFNENKKMSMWYHNRLFLAEEDVCTSFDQIEPLHDKYIAEGYEGAVIKSYSAGYVLSRTYHIMKYVKFHSVEAIISGFDKSRGTEEGAIIFSITLSNGLGQGVRPQGTIALRRQMYARGNEYIGRTCTIRYKSVTPDGRLHAPVMFRIG